MEIIPAFTAFVTRELQLCPASKSRDARWFVAEFCDDQQINYHTLRRDKELFLALRRKVGHVKTQHTKHLGVFTPKRIWRSVSCP